MPLPSPKEGEAEEDFNRRCMSDPKMMKEYPTQPQRFAICRRQWESAKNSD